MMGEGLDAGVIERSDPPETDAGLHAQEADVTSSQGLEPRPDGLTPAQQEPAPLDAVEEPVEPVAAPEHPQTPPSDEHDPEAPPEGSAGDLQGDERGGVAESEQGAEAAPVNEDGGQGVERAGDVEPTHDGELAAGGRGEGDDAKVEHDEASPDGEGGHGEAGQGEREHGEGDHGGEHGGGDPGGGHGGGDPGVGEHGGDGVNASGEVGDAVNGVEELLNGGILDLGGEIEGLSALLRGVGLLEALSILLFGLMGILAVRTVARWLRRSGLDPGNNVSRVSTVAIVVVVIVVLDLFFLWLLKYAPLVALVVFLLTVLVLGLSAVSLIQNLFAGVDIAMRGQLVPGVHVSIGDEEGIVERVGPTALALRTKDGATLQIPNSRFRADAFVTRGAERTARVDLRFKLRAPATQKNIEDARRAVILCPYRYHASEIQVAIDGAKGDFLVLAFEAPSESFAEHAAHFMRRALEAILV